MAEGPAPVWLKEALEAGSHESQQLGTDPANLQASSSALNRWVKQCEAEGSLYAQGGYQASGFLGLLNQSRVTYHLYLDGERLHGTAEDTIGQSSIEGTINRKDGSVRFIKSYTSFNQIDQKLVNGVLGLFGYKLEWEYVGSLRNDGIAGAWSRPGGPSILVPDNGTFNIWLPRHTVREGEKPPE